MNHFFLSEAMPKYYSKAEYIAELERNNRELRLENDALQKKLDEKQKIIDALKSRIKREKEKRFSDRSSSSVGTIQNIKSEKVLQLPRVFSIKEDAPVDVSVSSTGSDIKRRLQASLKIYPTEVTSSDQSSEVDQPVPQSSRLHQDQPEPSHQPVSAWVNRAPHLAYVMASYKPEDVPKTHLPLMNFPPLFANPYMPNLGPFSIPSTAAPSSASTPTAARTPQQQPAVNWQIPPPVLFGLAPNMYISRPQN